MKLNEKIQQLREERGLSRKALWQEIKKAFEDKALDYRTLGRIEKGETDARGLSLSQITTVLGVTLNELYEGVEVIPPSVECIRIYDYKGKYIYNEKAYAELLTDAQFNCGISRLIVKPGGETKPEQDPDDENKFKKWICILKGAVVCFVGDKKYNLRKGDVIKFRSHLPHRFANVSSRDVHCLIIQEPRHL
jgi:quercetin dioxygenase-like cupin family protein